MHEEREGFDEQIALTVVKEGDLFLYEGKEFIPSIAEEWEGEEVLDFNSVEIALDIRPTSLLNWDASLKLAAQAVQLNKLILWRLDFDLEDIDFSDEMQGKALELAIGHFSEKIFPLYEKNSLGALLFKGAADFSRLFPWKKGGMNWGEEFKEWCKDKAVKEHHAFSPTHLRLDPLQKQHLNLFCRDQIVEFLEPLVALLPEQLLAFIWLDQEGLSKAEFAQLSLRSTWPYYEKIETAPKRLEIKTGVVVPAYVPTFEIESILKSLDEKKAPYKILDEAYLREEWDGLEEIIVPSEGLSSLSLRTLMGFSAAGGKVIAFEKNA